LDRYKLPGSQIPAGLTQAGGKRCVLRSTNLFIVYGRKKNCHSSWKNLLLYLFIKRAIKLT